MKFTGKCLNHWIPFGMSFDGVQDIITLAIIDYAHPPGFETLEFQNFFFYSTS